LHSEKKFVILKQGYNLNIIQVLEVTCYLSKYFD
jgi:hypothetical protein